MFEIPTVYVAFGVTGDLFKRKILGSLYNLYLEDNLPKKFTVFGFSRRDWRHEELRDYLEDIMKKENTNKKILRQSQDSQKEFLRRFFYFKGDFDNTESFNKLAKAVGLVDKKWNFCSNKIFHLAVPPIYYQEILNNLKKTGLTKPCSVKEGWTRVMIEKPFGNDLKTAEKLDNKIAKYFKEEQIYRIDHYLAKEALQNILFFRFSNNLFESSWNNDYVEKINISLFQPNLVNTRGNFYDGVGELRDMGQSHALQMLSLVTMDNPTDLTAENIRCKRYNILKDIKVMDKKLIKQQTKRGQYKGYIETEGVEKKSTTETYFAVELEILNKNWEGVPIIIESGKATLPASSKSSTKVEVFFKHPNPCFCPKNSDHRFRNKVTFELSPINQIKVEMWYKKPGLETGLDKRDFSFPYPSNKESKDYGKLIYDCIKGDQTLFVSSKEVKAMWKFIDPIICGWDKGWVPLKKYEPGTLIMAK
jgi:glucose-6-phosphate 1-dehydrogenase